MIRFFAIFSLIPLLCMTLQAIPVRVLAWDSQIAGMSLAIGDAKGSKPIEGMHPSKRTDVYQVATGDTPPFIELLDRKAPDGKPLKEPIKITAGIKRPLVIILPDEKAVTGLRLFVIEDDSGNFGWGSTSFINATGRQIVFVHEKKVLAIPASWDPVLANPGGVDRNMEVGLFFRDQPKRPFYSGVWEQTSNLRMLVILVPGTDPRLGPVSLKMIPEDKRLIAEPPKESPD